MAVPLLNSPSHVDGLYTAYGTGFGLQLVNAYTITATDNTGIFSFPYVSALGKIRLIVSVTAISGASASLTVAYQESVDGVTLNPTPALTTSALTATGETWVAAATGPIYNTGELVCTVAGTTPSVTFSAWLAVWNK